jgi:hypothetical protein
MAMDSLESLHGLTHMPISTKFGYATNPLHLSDGIMFMGSRIRRNVLTGVRILNPVSYASVVEGFCVLYIPAFCTSSSFWRSDTYPLGVVF